MFIRVGRHFLVSCFYELDVFWLDLTNLKILVATSLISNEKKQYQHTSLTDHVLLLHITFMLQPDFRVYLPDSVSDPGTAIQKNKINNWQNNQTCLNHARSDCLRQGRIQGSVWLSLQVPLYHRYSALKSMIKYQTLSLQVSNACGLDQATAYAFLLTLHSTFTKQQPPCLV